MNPETRVQNKIRVALSERGCIVLRCNTGLFYTKKGFPVMCGVVGHSDLYGHRPDGKAFYLEVKTPKGKASQEQKDFIAAMLASGARAGFARTIDDALKVVFGPGHSGM